MKILVRELDDKIYEWINAEYKGKNFIVDGDIVVRETNIVSVDEDNRSNYVKCAACGEIFEKGSKAIEEHKKKYTDCSACFNCTYLREEGANNLNTKYTLQDDGSYVSEKKYNTKLFCGTSWYHTPDIKSEEARQICAFRGCINAEMVSIEDIFMTHPGIFDDIISIDKIIDAGYKDAYECFGGTKYQLKGRNNIWAYVNSMNIVDCFYFYYKNCTYQLFYSNKYNEFYVRNRRNDAYVKFRDSSIPDKTIEYLKKIIAALYS